MKLDEDKLSTAIKSREISRVNYLYGEERFLVKTYTDRLLDATVGKDRNDINLIEKNSQVHSLLTRSRTVSTVCPFLQTARLF